MRPRVRQTSVAGSKRDVDVNTEMTKFLISALKWCLISKKPVDIPGTFLTMLWLLKRLSWSRDVISTWIGSKQSNKLGCTLTMSWCRNCRWLEWEGLGDLRWYVFTRSCLKTRFQLDPKNAQNETYALTFSWLRLYRLLRHWATLEVAGCLPEDILEWQTISMNLDLCAACHFERLALPSSSLPKVFSNSLWYLQFEYVLKFHKTS